MHRVSPSGGSRRRAVADDGIGTELPHKDGTHDHPIDALRYFFVNIGGAGRPASKSY